jgi:colicin import membrane protein
MSTSFSGIKFSKGTQSTFKLIFESYQEWCVDTDRIPRSDVLITTHLDEFFAEVEKPPQRTRRAPAAKLTLEEKAAKVNAKKAAKGEWGNPKRFQTVDGKQHRSCNSKKDGSPGAWLRVKQHNLTGKWLMCTPKNWGAAEKTMFTDMYGDEAKVEKVTKSIINKLKDPEPTDPVSQVTPVDEVSPAAIVEEKVETPEEKLKKKVATAKAKREAAKAKLEAAKAKKEAAKAKKEATKAKKEATKAKKEAAKAKQEAEITAAENTLLLEEEAINEDSDVIADELETNCDDTFEHKTFPGLKLRKDGDMIYDATSDELVGMEDESGEIITVS